MFNKTLEIIPKSRTIKWYDIAAPPDAECIDLIIIGIQNPSYEIVHETMENWYTKLRKDGFIAVRAYFDTGKIRVQGAKIADEK